MKALLDWLDHRTGYKLLVHEALNEPIPGGARYRYVPGSMLTFVFMVQVITGFFLWSAYSPSTLTAWESVYYIQYEMDYGSLVRGIHAFAAQAMVVLMVVHFLQVIWDKAYIAPREVNFWLGLVLAWGTSGSCRRRMPSPLRLRASGFSWTTAILVGGDIPPNSSSGCS